MSVTSPLPPLLLVCVDEQLATQLAEAITSFQWSSSAATDGGGGGASSTGAAPVAFAAADYRRNAQELLERLGTKHPGATAED